MDPIADMFSQIYTAQRAGYEQTIVPFSRMKMGILEILKKSGKIGDFKEIKEQKFRKIQLKLLPTDNWQAQKISKPGKRVYASNGNIPRPKNYNGVIIVSTSQGIMLGEDARKKGLGGEIIAEVA